MFPPSYFIHCQKFFYRIPTHDYSFNFGRAEGGTFRNAWKKQIQGLKNQGFITLRSKKIRSHKEKRMYTERSQEERRGE